MKKLLIALLGLVAWTNTYAAQVTPQDIVELLAQKKIDVKNQGSGIDSLELQVRQIGNQNLVVWIPVGTFFVSNNGSTQNMVTTEEHSVTLRNAQWTRITVPAACASISKDIPGSGDSFEILRSPHQAELARLIPVLHKARVPFPVRQAAIWIITDNASYSGLGILVDSPTGFGGSRVIKEREVAQALKIIDQTGIEISTRRIWQDREKIVSGLKDEALKRWLRQKAGE